MTYSASATDHEANGQYGPGHNSFTISEDGSQDILVYHARSYREIVGDPLYDPNRHTRVHRILGCRERIMNRSPSHDADFVIGVKTGWINKHQTD